ncbi:YqiA/YcfP family alpha/beta fold hydrolase [Inmirania thermothiophila]|uniref:Esterase n=1 Tax=Inmirania thermothiophila TaxID=1750597 RepID=A0A3N1Y2U2_9GAMM|nr:YqiA/YcfP family alpha/beta fold hydrolase [Inmirania thermothiophila]ROR32828.1 hypothetical protein EDC57_2042 [Inmirania thermothiophila]
MHWIYLHGFASGPATTKGTFLRTRLAACGIDLETPDLNLPRFETLTLTAQVEAVRGRIAAAPGPVALVGSSMGGYVAALVADDEPRVAALALLAPAFRFLERYLAHIGEAAHDAWRRRGWMEVAHYARGGRHRLHYGLVEDARRHPAEPGRRTLPALVVHGIRDEVVPWSDSVRYLERNPQAELLLLAADHALTDRLETLWRALRAWGAALDPRLGRREAAPQSPGQRPAR